MRNWQVIRARKYLSRYEQILQEMTKQMISPNISNNISINFIECMIPHHQAAILMSENLLEYTRYQPLEEITKNIIKRQTEDITKMQEIAKNTYGFLNMSQDINCYIEKYFEITKNMIEKMKNTCRSININLNFTNEMIPHHEGAILMCKNLLKYRIDSRLKCIADSIMNEQSKNIEELKEIQKKIR